MANCLGCGIAPDGITYLGKNLYEYALSVPSLILLAVIYFITLIIINFTTNKLRSKKSNL